MSVLNRRPALRWLLPLAAVVVATTIGSLVTAVTANAGDSLQPRTAARLLTDVQQARLGHGLSGTVVQSAHLGIPSLPGQAGDQSSSFGSLVSGSHTLRVWYAGPRKARIALLGQLGESDVIRNGSDVWLWSSHDNAARHFTVPGGGRVGPKVPPTSPDQAMTPQQAADAALKAITPTTRVSTDPTAVVAGRPAYQLVLEPRDPGTLIGSVTIAIDGATHLPTRVQVFARGATEPAFETEFTSFDASAPSPSVFAFTPPPGAKVTEGQGDPGLGAGTPLRSRPDRTSPEPQVVGSGWGTVVLADLPKAGAPPSGAGTGNGSTPFGNLGAVVKSLPEVSGTWGSGHLLRGALFSVLLTDDGRVVAGAVPPDRLYAVAARQ
jgi:outer membrane lipoprotein-sorting protein